MIAIEKYNLFDMKCAYLDNVNRESLFYSFQIFLTGSLFGLIFYRLNNSNYEFVVFKRIRFLLNYVSLIMFLYGLKRCSGMFKKDDFPCTLKFSIYWSFFMFLILLQDRGFIKDLFNFSFLKKCGHYSFGIYLLHIETFALANFIRNNGFMNQSAIELIILVIVICYAYGAIFFHFIENPAMNMGNLIIKKVKNIMHTPIEQLK